MDGLYIAMMFGAATVYTLVWLVYTADLHRHLERSTTGVYLGDPANMAIAMTVSLMWPFLAVASVVTALARHRKGE